MKVQYLIYFKQSYLYCTSIHWHCDCNNFAEPTGGFDAELVNPLVDMWAKSNLQISPLLSYELFGLTTRPTNLLGLALKFHI